MIAYKYLYQEHLDNFRNSGQILVSTLNSFKKLSTKREIRDESEAKHTTIIKPELTSIYLSPTKAHQTYPQAQFSDPRGMEITPNAQATSVIEISNAFVFCASLKCSKKIEEYLGYNSFYKILDLDCFAYTLVEELQKQYPIKGCKILEVKYVEKPNTIRNQEDVGKIQKQDYWSIASLKDKAHKNQREIRLVFPIKSNKEIEPKILYIPELRKYCHFK